MSIGTLESIAASLAGINDKLGTLQGLAGTATGETTPAVSTTKTAAKTSAAAGKKVASKKKASSRRGKADDLSDITTFKKRLFDVAEASGVDDVMPKLKAFIKAEGYGSSDEIEPDDRATFLASVKEHFAEMQEEGEEEADDDIDGL